MYPAASGGLCHPADRITEITHDVFGNLQTITDPDGSVREFRYDGSNRMVGETTKRGFEERTEYRGRRAVKSIRRDGTVLEFLPAHFPRLVTKL